MRCCAEDDPREWPGPKAWPATLALISFFAVNVFGQVQTSCQCQQCNAQCSLLSCTMMLNVKLDKDGAPYRVAPAFVTSCMYN